jgi:hypothetical protein
MNARNPAGRKPARPRLYQCTAELRGVERFPRVIAPDRRRRPAIFSCGEGENEAVELRILTVPSDKLEHFQIRGRANSRFAHRAILFVNALQIVLI